MSRQTAAASLSALFLVTACAPRAEDTVKDPYSGLETQILAWRGALEATHPACSVKVGGRGCESFEITCKAAQEITPDERAQGVSAQVVAAMTFNGRNTDGSSGRPGSAFAVFSKAAKVWTRTETRPVNMTSCAPI